MARLTLFGETRDFTTGGESYPGFGGSPQNLLEGRLAADQKSLDLGFSGDLPHARVSFRALFGCRVDAGTLHLTQTLSVTQQPRVELRLFSGGPLPSPALVVGPALRETGIGFRDTRNALKGRMEVLRLPLATVSWLGLGGWTGNVVGFDSPKGELVLQPESISPRPGVVFVDELAGEQPPDLIHRQELMMSLIRIGSGSWTASFVPPSGALFLHPDVLDTTLVQRHGPEGQELPNDFLYQYALANGSLEIHFDPDSLTDHKVFWRGRGEEESPVLVCFRLQDEHGHPLLLSSQDRSFRIDQRNGITLEVAQRDLTDEWEQTNRAALIEALAPDGEEGRIPCRVRTLDPVRLPRGPRLRNSLTNPYWLQGGRVPVSDRAPREVHGLAKGVFLRRTNGSGELTAEIATSAVREEGLGKLFVRTDLVLPSAAGWTLFAQTEERELSAGAQQEPSALEVGMRSAAGDGGGELRLPMIDTSYAFANLAGLRRVQRDGQGEPTGERLGSGVLFSHGYRWIEAIDRQMTGAAPENFALPRLSEQTHTSGFGERPAADQPFHSVVDRPPTQAATPADTARTGVLLQTRAAPSPLATGPVPEAGEVPFRSVFTFGGTRGQEDALLEHLRSTDPVGEALARFQRIWADDRELQPNQREALAALRGVLAEPRPMDPNGLPAGYLQEALGRAHELARSNLRIPWLEEIHLALADWSLEDLARAWRDGSDPIAALLCDYLWAPSSVELFRRAASLLFPERRFEKDLTPEQIIAKIEETLPGPLLSHRDVLRKDLVPFVQDWEKALTKNLKGFLAEVAQGVDGRYDDVVALWRSGAGAVLDELRRKYGPELSPDVYASLLETAAAVDAAALVNVLRDLGIELERLADLKNDPPDYLLITRRFRTVGQPDSSPTDALWRHRFDLCDFGDKLWHFFLDNDSTVIVKLTGARTLPEILRQAEAAYRAPGRPNPLGVPANLLTPETKSPAEGLIARLHPDLLARDWRGVLVIAPMADIGEDKTLRDLAGLEYIQAAYVALGGRKPGDEKLDLDVYANIFQQAGVRHEDKESDVQFALVKFDATIKHTTIESGEIVFQIDLKDLWGRQMRDAFKQSGPIFVRGTLPRETKREGKGRSFEFAAWFEKPFKAQIDVSFVHAFLFRAIRVGRAHGQTSLEIDGDLVLRKSGANLPIDLPGGDQTSLTLDGFRILLPDQASGLKISLGRARALNFDFPALSFRLPKQRVFNVWGIELELLGMGYIRNAPKALETLHDDHLWLAKLELPTANVDFVFPYLDFRLDFGKVPRFGTSVGDVQVGDLDFRGVIGVQWQHGDNPKASFGLRRLEAKDIRIQLFWYLALEIEKLSVAPWIAQLPGGPEAEVGAILAEDIHLKILDWSVLPPQSKLSGMLLQPRDLDSQQKGFLAWYQNESVGGGFFHLDWLLFAHNLELPTKVHDTLQSHRIRTLDIPRNLLEGLVDEPNRKIQARLLDQESWIFGASFALGKIFDRCSLILHDQHYYGIRLAADWVQAAFGVPEVELAYIPGPRRELDRFRTSLRIPSLDLLGTLRSGELVLEWGVNWDFLIDVGFPWQRAGGYDWLRSFSMPAGIYEARFGFYLEKRNQLAPAGNKQLVLSAGVGFYLGYQFGFSSSIVWLRAGIGVFGLFQGRAVLEGATEGNLLKGSLVELEVVGVVGIFAYGEGGIDVWILSARFRVTLQAAIALSIHYQKNLPCVVTYRTTLAAGYSASVRVGSGWFSWTFRVSGHVNIGVSGRLLLS